MKRKIVFYYLPYVCQISVFLNTILASFGLSRVYVIFYFIALVPLFFQRSRDRVDKYVISYLFIFAVSILMIIYLAFSTLPLNVVLVGSLTYILPLLYWVLYFAKGGEYFCKILYDLRYPLLIIAIFCPIQYFISPTLFGLFSESAFLTHAEDYDLLTRSEYFRAGSILGSDFETSMFLSLYICVLYTFDSKNKLNLILILFYTFACVLTGSKNFIMILGIFIFYNAYSKHNVGLIFKVVIPVIFTSYFILSSLNIDFDNSFIQRMVDIDVISQNENIHDRYSRVGKWLRIIVEPTLFGHGPGVFQSIGSQASLMNGNSAESYFLQIYYELGVLVLFIFLFLVYDCYMRVHKSCRVFILLIFACMVVVQIFGSLTFFVMWGLFFVNKQLKYENYSVSKK